MQASFPMCSASSNWQCFSQIWISAGGKHRVAHGRGSGHYPVADRDRAVIVASQKDVEKIFAGVDALIVHPLLLSDRRTRI